MIARCALARNGGSSKLRFLASRLENGRRSFGTDFREALFRRIDFIGYLPARKGGRELIPFLVGGRTSWPIDLRPRRLPVLAARRELKSATGDPARRVRNTRDAFRGLS